MYTTSYPSPLGTLALLSDGENLSGLWLEGSRHFGNKLLHSAVPCPELPLFQKTAAWLDGYFRGQIPQNTPPLMPTGTDFQKQVWQQLLAIPYGATCSYGQIAAAVGNSRACQAVGQAVGRNPISIIIPCHRVLGQNGSLTGFAGGIDKKIWLLDHEKRYCK